MPATARAVSCATILIALVFGVAAGVLQSYAVLAVGGLLTLAFYAWRWNKMTLSPSLPDGDMRARKSTFFWVAVEGLIALAAWR